MDTAQLTKIMHLALAYGSLALCILWMIKDRSRRLASQPAAKAPEQPSKLSKKQTLLIKLVAVIVLVSLGVALGRHLARDLNLHDRVHLALEQTVPLRDKIAAFRLAQQRWPAASDLDVAAVTHYPAGGSYRLQPDGSIVITFAVVPELKGRSIHVRPSLSQDGKSITWACTADPEIPENYYRYC